MEAHARLLILASSGELVRNSASTGRSYPDRKAAFDIGRPDDSPSVMGLNARENMTNDRKLWQRQIEREAYRRIMAGEAPETLGELAGQILSWFRETHPGSHPMTLHKVEDQIRDTWYRCRELIRGS